MESEARSNVRYRQKERAFMSLEDKRRHVAEAWALLGKGDHFGIGRRFLILHGIILISRCGPLGLRHKGRENPMRIFRMLSFQRINSHSP